MPDRRVELGDAVRRSRIEQGFQTQRALADAVGMSRRRVNEVEGGKAVTPATLSEIEVGLGWEPGTADRILTGSADRGNPTVAHLDLRDEFEREVWSLTTLPADERLWTILLRRRQVAGKGDDLLSPGVASSG